MGEQTTPLTEAVPDAITPLVGYRAWTLGFGRLWSPQAPSATPWPVESELVASCRRFEKRSPFQPAPIDPCPHSAPDPNCTCGIHAVHEPWEIDAVDTRPPFRLVVGAVTGWGRVVLCDRGWRAERARVESLFAYPWWDERMRAAVTRIARAYRVPVVDGVPAQDRGRV